MRTKLLYVELKTGYSDNGPAWIGMGSFSRSGRSVYFNGMAFSGSGGGMHTEPVSGNEYWMSGVKKNGGDRHKNGYGKICIDKGVVAEYLAIIKQPALPQGKYEIVELDKRTAKEALHELANRKL